MANIQQLKNKVNNLVSGLSPNKKAELYFQDRKRYVKLSMEGNHTKALKVLNESDDFYKRYQREDLQAFNNAKWKFIHWWNDYQCFKQYQDSLADADREYKSRKNDLTIIECISEMLLIYKESKDEEQLNRLIDILASVIEKWTDEISDYPLIISSIESEVENNHYFKDNNYFEDVDQLGYKNIDWKTYFEYRTKVNSNGGPIIPEDKLKAINKALKTNSK